MIRYTLVLLSALALPGVTHAQAQSQSLAEVGLQAQIEALSDQSSARGFELGMLIALRAVERSMQTRYEYGLGDRMVNLPLLRIEIGERNPAPKKPAADTLTEMMKKLLFDLNSARAVLGNAKDNDAVNPFEFNLHDLWFDVNSNGKREEGEAAVRALAPILLGRRAMRNIEEHLEEDISIRFDKADHAWLSAYTHMLSGFGNLFVAFDPAPVISELTNQTDRLAQLPTVPNTFDQEAIGREIKVLEAERERLQAEIKTQEARLEDFSASLPPSKSETHLDQTLQSVNRRKIREFRQEFIRPLQDQRWLLRLEIDAAQAKLGNSRRRIEFDARAEIDAVYVLIAALRQQPDKRRIAAVRDHWTEMMAQNRLFWTMLAKETDNDREWVPNPSQSGAFGIAVDQQVADAWQAILEDAEALLDGRLLMPHMLLPDGAGISLKAYFDNPGPIDLLEWIHGIGAYKYAAKGPMITGQRWTAFNRLTRGNAGGFALFFN